MGNAGLGMLPVVTWWGDDFFDVTVAEMPQIYKVGYSRASRKCNRLIGARLRPGPEENDETLCHYTMANT